MARWDVHHQMHPGGTALPALKGLIDVALTDPLLWPVRSRARRPPARVTMPERGVKAAEW